MSVEKDMWGKGTSTWTTAHQGLEFSWRWTPEPQYTTLSLDLSSTTPSVALSALNISYPQLSSPLFQRGLHAEGFEF